MKKVISIVICLIICVAFPGCSKEEEITIQNQYEEYVVNLFEETYNPYYKIEDFEFSNTELLENKNSIEATFLFKMIYKNQDKDPNTVDYIRNEKNPDTKKRLIDEYDLIQESSFDIRLTAEINNNKIDEETIEILANSGVLDNEYYPIEEYFPE